MATSDIARELYGSKYITINPTDALVATGDTEAAVAVIMPPENCEVEQVSVATLTAAAGGDGITVNVRRGSLTGTVLASVAYVSASTTPGGAVGGKGSATVSANEILFVSVKLLTAGDDFTGVTIVISFEPLKTNT